LEIQFRDLIDRTMFSFISAATIVLIVGAARKHLHQGRSYLDEYEKERYGQDIQTAATDARHFVKAS